MIGAIQSTVMQKLPALIDVLIMQMQPKTQHKCHQALEVTLMKLLLNLE